MLRRIAFVSALCFIWISATAFGQGKAGDGATCPGPHAPLFFRVDWQGVPDSTRNPMHLWTGLCAQPCAMALRGKYSFVDLTGMAKIRWVTKISDLHQVHPILKLAGGSWILGEHGDGSVLDYHTADFTLSETWWIALDIEELVTRGRRLDKVDLSRVDEIEFTDLLPGSGHGDGGYTDLGFLEVYGNPGPRAGAGQKSQ